ncbi:hypothetical protein CSKR_109618 [Clonorchis sinensis]|uniref:Uncharacterized protein n=1 Tax=Clonorchis sinensis TaxID=79923 RepID=A0A419PXW5_CLOSI|nr:hypothetical protein CSKR_109618 [Clonorchis sinensis]
MCLRFRLARHYRMGETLVSNARNELSQKVHHFQTDPSCEQPKKVNENKVSEVKQTNQLFRLIVSSYGEQMYTVPPSKLCKRFPHSPLYIVSFSGQLHKTLIDNGRVVKRNCLYRKRKRKKCKHHFLCKIDFCNQCFGDGSHLIKHTNVVNGQRKTAHDEGGMTKRAYFRMVNVCVLFRSSVGWKRKLNGTLSSDVHQADGRASLFTKMAFVMIVRQRLKSTGAIAHLYFAPVRISKSLAIAPLVFTFAVITSHMSRMKAGSPICPIPHYERFKHSATAPLSVAKIVNAVVEPKTAPGDSTDELTRFPRYVMLVCTADFSDVQMQLVFYCGRILDLANCFLFSVSLNNDYYPKMNIKLWGVRIRQGNEFYYGDTRTKYTMTEVNPRRFSIERNQLDLNILVWTA